MYPRGTPKEDVAYLRVETTFLGCHGRTYKIQTEDKILTRPLKGLIYMGSRFKTS